MLKVMNTEAINQIQIQQLKWQQRLQTNETNLMRTVTQIRKAINTKARSGESLIHNTGVKWSVTVMCRIAMF